MKPKNAETDCSQQIFHKISLTFSIIHNIFNVRLWQHQFSPKYYKPHS